MVVRKRSEVSAPSDGTYIAAWKLRREIFYRAQKKIGPITLPLSLTVDQLSRRGSSIPSGFLLLQHILFTWTPGLPIFFILSLPKVNPINDLSWTQARPKPRHNKRSLPVEISLFNMNLKCMVSDTEGRLLASIGLLQK